jgi:hypothetical protein
MPRNTQTNLVLLEIAQGLKELAKNPSLESSIKEAYELTEGEKLAYENALQTIANAESIKAELQAREDAIADIDKRIAEAEKLEAFNEDTLKSIQKQNSEIARAASKNAEDAVKNQKSLDEIEAKEAEFAIKLAALNDKEAALNEYESRLNKAASAAQDALKVI